MIPSIKSRIFKPQKRSPLPEHHVHVNTATSETCDSITQGAIELKDMRVLLDAHMLGEQETGNETYIRGLIAGIHEANAPVELVIAAAKPATVLDQLPTGSPATVHPVSSNPWQRLFRDLPKLAAAQNVDIIHSTYICPPLVRSVPQVVTIHDISYRHEPKWFSLRDRMILNAGIWMSTRRSTALITVSEYSAMDICKSYGIERSRIYVTHEAASRQFQQEPKPAHNWEGFARLGIFPPYLLAVCNLQPRKNLPRLIESYAALRSQIPQCPQLVLVGKPQWRGLQIAHRINELGLMHSVVLTGFVEDNDLHMLYRGALAFIYPSLFEGFGLPVLEAMASGTPVITSNSTSLAEVAKDAALLIDPIDTGEITTAMSDVIQDTSLRESLKSRGLKRAAEFSWAETARRTVDVYRAATQSGAIA